jgi:transposase, IS5 family
MLKICLLAHFYDISERHFEVYVNENIPAKYFVGLGLDQRAPDHSTVSVFKKTAH